MTLTLNVAFVTKSRNVSVTRENLDRGAVLVTASPRLEHVVIVVVAAVIEENGSYLVTRRVEGTHLAGFWEFPGGKIAAGESHAAALTREIREELDSDVDVGTLVYETQFAYEDRMISLQFYRCTLLGRPRPLLGQQMRWIPRTELQTLDFPPADAELIRQLKGLEPR